MSWKHASRGFADGRFCACSNHLSKRSEEAGQNERGGGGGEMGGGGGGVRGRGGEEGCKKNVFLLGIRKKQR